MKVFVTGGSGTTGGPRRRPAIREITQRKDAMATLAYTRSGAGAPLVLLHGIGSSRHAWDPVIPTLAGHFDVLAIDLPGFGDSGLLPPGAGPGPAALAAAVAGLLGDLGITAPHVAGNSLGGWVALELAGIRPVASSPLNVIGAAAGLAGLVLLIAGIVRYAAARRHRR